MENWKPIEGYVGLYEVSDQGRVRSIKRDGRLLTACKVAHGYLAYNLYKEGKQRSILAHRLVAKAFIPNPDNKPQVNHIDGVKSHNSVDNLEWATAAENIWHAEKMGLKPSCPTAPTPAIIMIRIRESKGWTQKELADKAGVGLYTIQSLEQNKRFIRERCVSTIHKIARVLGVSIETLAGYDQRG